MRIKTPKRRTDRCKLHPTVSPDPALPIEIRITRHWSAMTHIDLAKVWIQLRSCANMSNVFREILGELALSVAGEKPDTTFELSLPFTVWIKAVFDLQHTYLLEGNSSDIPRGRLVSPSCLLAAIQKVVDIKQDADALRHKDQSQYPQQRYFMAQVVLSGLRVLLLGNINLVSDGILTLETRLKAWETSAPQHSAEKFIMDKCVSAIESVHSSIGMLELGLQKPACGLVSRRC